MGVYDELVNKQRSFFRTGRTKEIEFRREALSSLARMIRTHEKEIILALKQDLNKSEFDSYLTEIGILLEEIRFTLKHLKEWAQPRKVKSTLAQFGSKSYIYPEPYGVALIISPWNYPFQLALAPLIGAISAGNCAVIKPSELTPNTSHLIAELIGNTFDENYIVVVEGAVEVSQNLLQEKFDSIFFTGSIKVGKLVMEAAAKHLTPVTLELGGKSPCIVHKDANLSLAAKRIAWGKYLNAGQTCVAPDYVYVHQEIKDQFLRILIQAIEELVGQDVMRSRDFTRIVSDDHFDRLISFLSNQKIVYGGRYKKDSLIIEPTVIDQITWEDPIMKDEIFGPILPILDYTEKSILIEEITNRPKPLALYLFSESKLFQDTILQQVSFGGGCINDTLYHLSSPYLPFGGVGESGMGAYHGKGSFDVFSHEKSILKQTTAFDMPFRYGKRKDALDFIKRFIR